MQRKILGLVVVVVVVLSACGRDDPETQAGPVTGAPASAATSAPASQPEGLDAGAFGDLGVICQPGDAQPITDQTGIDGTTISLGTFSDQGFSAAPGLNVEFNDIAEAFTAWCNEHGGVQGYQIETDPLDAKFAEYQNRIVEACDRDFALVGGGAANDAAQAPRLECGLPDFPGYLATDEAVNADLYVPAVPNGAGTWGAGDYRWLGEQFPESTDAVGSLLADYPLTVTINERNTEVMESLGWDVVLEQRYNPLGETSWVPFAQSMKDAGVEGLVYVGEPQNLAKFLQAAQDIEFDPAWVRADTNSYDTKYIEVGGDAVDGTYIRSLFWPLERADENIATQQYLDLLEQYNPDGKIAQLGQQGLSAWLLFVTSLNACIDAGTLTRDCVYSTANAVTEWTGGGLHAPTDPSSQRFPECYTMIATEGGEFVNPPVDANFDRIYNCDPSNVAELENTGADVGVHCPSGLEDPLPSTCPE